MSIIAKNPSELTTEGKALNHCVGQMNYDQKFAREETLIFFIRNISSPDIPFVTVEYSLEKHKILQCYGYHDTKPDTEVLNYVIRSGCLTQTEKFVKFKRPLSQKRRKLL